MIEKKDLIYESHSNEDFTFLYLVSQRTLSSASHARNLRVRKKIATRKWMTIHMQIYCTTTAIIFDMLAWVRVSRTGISNFTTTNNLRIKTSRATKILGKYIYIPAWGALILRAKHACELTWRNLHALRMEHHKSKMRPVALSKQGEIAQPTKIK